MAQRSFLAPEVLQISSMDCGIAALRSMLAGYEIGASYAKLRDACQTSVDGTSIDALEDLCRDLGMDVCQHIVPVDLFSEIAAARMPLLAVTRTPNGLLHYVAVWSMLPSILAGQPRLQIMDPRGGRRWPQLHAFEKELYEHPLRLSVDDWRAWMTQCSFAKALRQCSQRTLSKAVFDAEVDGVLSALEPWQISAVDAALRLLRRAEQVDGTKSLSYRDTLFLRARDAALAAKLPKSLRTIEVEDGVVCTRGAVLLAPVRAEGGAPQRSTDLAPVAVAETHAPRAAGVKAPLDLAETGPASVFQQARSLLDGGGRNLALAMAAAIVCYAFATGIELLAYRAALDAPRLFATGAGRIGFAAAVGTLLLLLASIELALAIGSRRLARHFELRLRMQTLWAMPRVDDTFVRSRPISDLAYRAHGLTAAGAVIFSAVQFVRAASEVSVTLLAIALLDLRYAAVAVVFGGVLVATWAVSRATLTEIDTRLQVHASRLLMLLLDALRGIRPVRLHGFQDALRDKHQDETDAWKASSRKLTRALARLNAGYDIVDALLVTSLFLLFLKSQADARVFVLLALWAYRIPPVLRRLVQVAEVYPLQRNALLRLLEVTQYPSPGNAASPESKPPPSKIAGAVTLRFDGVSVVAAGHAVLDQIDLTIPAGQHVAIVGPSGSGKSTLVGLLLGFHEPAAGVIRVDDAPFDNAVLRRLRDASMWIDPSVQLWNDSLGANLDYAVRGGAKRDTQKVLAEADLFDVLAGLDRGLDTPVGAEGAFLSAGEGQRLRVGRGLHRARVRLAILDEPFRGLERPVRERMTARVRDSMRNVTMLFVSHDMAQALTFDRVLVVLGGRIVEDGAPRDLASTQSRFASLLRAEERVQQEAWGAPDWRRIRIENGVIRESTHER